jgi:hypothetical protein
MHTANIFAFKCLLERFSGLLQLCKSPNFTFQRFLFKVSRTSFNLASEIGFITFDLVFLFVWQNKSSNPMVRNIGYLIKHFVGTSD